VLVDYQPFYGQEWQLRRNGSASVAAGRAKFSAMTLTERLLALPAGWDPFNGATLAIDADGAEAFEP